jgi:hypothetical protein
MQCIAEHLMFNINVGVQFTVIGTVLVGSGGLVKRLIAQASRTIQQRVLPLGKSI